jgi:hypothetical protein
MGKKSELVAMATGSIGQGSLAGVKDVLEGTAVVKLAFALDKASL